MCAALIAAQFAALRWVTWLAVPATAIVHVDTSRQLPRQNADRVKTPSNNSDQEMEMGEIIGGASSNDDGDGEE